MTVRMSEAGDTPRASAHSAAWSAIASTLGESPFAALASTVCPAAVETGPAADRGAGAALAAPLEIDKLERTEMASAGRARRARCSFVNAHPPRLWPRRSRYRPK